MKLWKGAGQEPRIAGVDYIRDALINKVPSREHER
jgi:hypothetical protein